MGAILHVDHPTEHVLDEAIARISGWWHREKPGGGVGLRIADRPIEWITVDRPDVTRVYPDGESNGFCVLLDLSKYLDLRGREALSLTLVSGEETLLSHDLRVTPEVWEEAARLGPVRQRKRKWLMERLRCPACGGALRQRHPETTGADHSELVCGSCDLTMPQRSEATLNLLPPEIADEAAISDTENVSLHPYDEVARGIIRDVGERGEMVLDCGSGLRTSVEPGVIACEVVDYPSTDLRAVNQNLPIQDNSFGAVLSLNVLEHVEDPFRCARELIRVLKPGGRLYCVVPFLQPLHGYPDHYFNMTKSGLARLFRGAGSVESHIVPPSGHPIWSLHWFLTSYLQSLPEDQRERFKDLTVGEIVGRSEEEWLGQEVVQHLTEKGRWTLASTTALVLKKS